MGGWRCILNNIDFRSVLRNVMVSEYLPGFLDMYIPDSAMETAAVDGWTDSAAPYNWFPIDFVKRYAKRPPP